jgi:hypothetical protein
MVSPPLLCKSSFFLFSFFLSFFSSFFCVYKDCASVLLWLVTKVAREYGSKIGFKVVFAVIFSSRYFLQSKCMADLFYDMWMGT